MTSLGPDVGCAAAASGLWVQQRPLERRERQECQVAQLERPLERHERQECQVALLSALGFDDHREQLQH